VPDCDNILRLSVEQCVEVAGIARLGVAMRTAFNALDRWVLS